MCKNDSVNNVWISLFGNIDFFIFNMYNIYKED